MEGNVRSEVRVLEHLSQQGTRETAPQVISSVLSRVRSLIAHFWDHRFLIEIRDVFGRRILGRITKNGELTTLPLTSSPSKETTVYEQRLLP